MIFGSCHFLFHQFTQRDEPDQIIADMDALTAFSAAFIDRQDLFFPKLLCDLHRSPAFHTKVKDVFDHLGSLFINYPLFGVLRIFDISEGRISREVFTSFTFGLVDRSDLPAG